MRSKMGSGAGMKLQARRRNNLAAARARRCFWMKSCQIVFDSLCAGRFLRCPRGAWEQSGFGISHSLSSQGLWPSADFTANCSLTPSLLLFGQLWIFTCYESNSVRHATVHWDNVRSVVCRIWIEDISFLLLYQILISMLADSKNKE